MCADRSSRREHPLWWALVSYFRAYPPLVQGTGLTPRPRAMRKPAREEATEAERLPIRIYW